MYMYTKLIKVFNSIKWDLLILSDEQNPNIERLVSMIKLICLSSPLVFISDLLGAWFTRDNQVFSTFVIACIMFNMLLGGIRHSRKMSFSWLTLLAKTGLMFLVLVVVYAGLEMVLMIAKDNIVTELFRIILQMSTLLYPLSKTFKSVYILTQGEYPPKWLMEKLYNFEKNGSLDQFLNIKDKEDGK